MLTFIKACEFETKEQAADYMVEHSGEGYTFGLREAYYNNKRIWIVEVWG